MLKYRTEFWYLFILNDYLHIFYKSLVYFLLTQLFVAIYNIKFIKLLV